MLKCVTIKHYYIQYQEMMPNRIIKGLKHINYIEICNDFVSWYTVKPYFDDIAEILN
jgi:hypothetical protein